MSDAAKRWVLYSVLYAGLLVGGWSALRAIPRSKRQKALAEEAQELEAELTSPGPNALALRREVDALHEELEALPPEAGPARQGDAVALARLATRHGLRVESSRDHQPVSALRVSEDPEADWALTRARRRSRRQEEPGLALTMRGGYFGLRGFLEELQELPHPLEVRRLEVDLEDVDATQDLAIELEVAR